VNEKEKKILQLIMEARTFAWTAMNRLDEAVEALHRGMMPFEQDGSAKVAAAALRMALENLEKAEKLAEELAEEEVKELLKILEGMVRTMR